jgi:hypothetical protein
MRIFGVVLATLFMLAACGSASSEYCQRKDKCNMLDGSSVDECADNVNTYLGKLSRNKRADCEITIDECLEKRSCGSFKACLADRDHQTACF